VDVANWLTEVAGKDYTFLHPEVLDEKCQTDKENFTCRISVIGKIIRLLSYLPVKLSQ